MAIETVSTIRNSPIAPLGDLTHPFANSVVAAYYQHPSAVVDEGAQINDGSQVLALCPRLRRRLRQAGVSLGQNVFVGNKVVIGDRCKVQENNVSVYDNVTHSEGVFCGKIMVFTNVYNPRGLIERKDQYRDTLVKRGATLGANCTIVCGVTIGAYAFVGAGAVVNKDDVPDFALVVRVLAASGAGWSLW